MSCLEREVNCTRLLSIRSSSEEAVAFLEEILESRDFRTVKERWEKRNAGFSSGFSVDLKGLISNPVISSILKVYWSLETDVKWGREDKDALFALKEAVVHAATYMNLLAYSSDGFQVGREAQNDVLEKLGLDVSWEEFRDISRRFVIFAEVFKDYFVSFKERFGVDI